MNDVERMVEEIAAQARALIVAIGTELSMKHRTVGFVILEDLPGLWR